MAGTRDAGRTDLPCCRNEFIRGAFETGCCPDIHGEVLLDRLTLPIRDEAVTGHRPGPEDAAS
jgi:hypothetical protein